MVAGLEARIAEILDRSQKKGDLSKFLSKPDSVWKTLGDTRLQQDLYKLLKEVVPTIDSAGLTTAKASVLSNGSLASLSRECGMQELVRSWSKHMPSSHNEIDGKDADGVEALYHFCAEESNPDSELRDAAKLVVCQLVCKRIAELSSTVKAQEVGSHAEQTTDSASSPSLDDASELLPNWVRDFEMSKLNLAFQKAWSTSKHASRKLRQPETEQIQGASSDKPAWQTSVSLDGTEDDLSDGPRHWSDMKKARATLLAKVLWLKLKEWPAYEEFLRQLRA